MMIIIIIIIIIIIMVPVSGITFLNTMHRLTKYKIDWDSAECITYSTNYQQRLTLESWYTNSEQEPLN